jgi:hypothetical protein
MVAPSSASSPPITEGKRLKDTLRHLNDCFLNRIFALTQHAAMWRAISLFIIAGVIEVAFSLHANTKETWTHTLNLIATSQNSWEILKGMWGLSAPFLFYGILLTIPFLLAKTLATSYLTDIFELEDRRIANRFIQQAATGLGYQTIRIGDGGILEGFQNHPIIRIGGPGYIIVQLDSAALFERMDGRPHVIGPTVKKPVPLEGFERLRAVIDLRNQQIGPQNLQDRSKEGILLKAIDLRILFSVWRGENEQERTSTLARPYPYKTEAIERLIYNQGCVVQPSGDSLCGSWTGAISGLVTGRLRNFINEHRLSEFFASIGEPETGKVQQLAESVHEKPPSIPQPENFVSYDQLSDIIEEFISGFSDTARNRGVEVQWIGIGTWEMPKQIIPERHRDAWKISRQNQIRKSKATLRRIRENASLQERMRLIQSVPVGVYRELQTEEDNTDLKILRQLLIAYRAQLKDIQNTLEEKSKSTPDELKITLKHLDNIIGHWI